MSDSGSWCSHCAERLADNDLQTWFGHLREQHPGVAAQIRRSAAYVLTEGEFILHAVDRGPTMLRRINGG